MVMRPMGLRTKNHCTGEGQQQFISQSLGGKGKTTRYAITLSFVYLTPDCWAEVSLHLEGPATGRHDQCFLWFSSVLTANAELVAKFPRCTACFTCSPLNGQIKNSP
jgi:hypothetical protein